MLNHGNIDLVSSDTASLRVKSSILLLTRKSLFLYFHDLGQDLVNHIDGLLSIYKKFDIVLTSVDTKKHKPNPDPYIAAMKRFGFEASECIVVEDSIQGIKAGKAAGCIVIALEGSIEREFLKGSNGS